MPSTRLAPVERVMRFSCSHLSDGALLRELTSAIARDRINSAVMLALIAEVETRRLFLPAGYSSMFGYCMGELHMSEDAAYRRIHAARAARKFPEILQALADGRLHLSGVSLLAHHLTSESVVGWLGAAEYKSKSEIERLLAERFPRPDVPFRLQPIASTRLASDSAAAIVKQLGPGRVEPPSPADSPGQQHVAPAPLHLPEPRPQLTPLSVDRFALRFTMSAAMHDKLQRARCLLSHSMPGANEIQVLERALEALIEQLEKRKFGATERPQHVIRESKNPRHVPAWVRRAVRRRDGDQCTYVAENGNRCEARSFLEFDHIEPVGRGGEASVANLRLRCRAHNQYAAEQMFGREFMNGKIQARRVAP